MIRPCPQCGQLNRIPACHLSDTGRCGKCKAELPPVAEPLGVDAEEFRDIVGGATVPVLVDFGAEWCGPCRMAAPEVKRVARSMAGKAIVLEVDTEANPALSQQYSISAIPSFLIFHRGKVVGQHPGLVNHAQLRRWLEDASAA